MGLTFVIPDAAAGTGFPFARFRIDDRTCDPQPGNSGFDDRSCDHAASRDRRSRYHSGNGGKLHRRAATSLLTDVEGLSHCFERGFVCYSETSKCDQLGLDQGEIDRHGAVSRSVAIAMAEGALARSNAEIAFAVTGFAGRGEEGDEPGLVHFACARHGGPTRHDEMPLRRHWPRRRPAKNRPPRGGNDARCGDALTSGQHCRPSRGC